MPKRKDIKYVSPKNSHDHKALLHYARKHNYSNKYIKSFLWKINAPGHLQAFLLICKNIKASIKQAQAHKLIESDNAEWNQWKRTCNFICDNSLELTCAIGSHFILKDIKENDHPYLGWGFTRYSLCSTLCNKQKNSNSTNAYALLRFILIHSHSHWSTKYISQYHYERYTPDPTTKIKSIYEQYTVSGRAHMYSASNALRKWSDPDNSNDVTSLADQITSLHLTISDISNYFKFLNNEKMPTRFHDFTVFIYRARISDWEIPHDRKDHVGGSGGYYPIPGHVTDISETLCIERLDNDRQLNDSTEHFILRKSSNDEKEKIIRYTDLYKEEVNDDETLHLIKYDCSDNTSIKSMVHAAKGRARAETLNNQHFTHQWENLSLWEISSLVEYCENRFKYLSIPLENAETVEDETVQELEAITLIIISVFTGHPLDVIVDMFYLHHKKSSYSTLTYLHDTGEIRIKAYKISHKTETTPEQDAICKTVKDNIILPDVFGIGRYITKVYETKYRLKYSKEDYVSKRIFEKKKLKRYKSLINKVFSNLPAGNRVTIKRIEYILFNHLLSDPSCDISEATLLTSKVTSTGGVQLHYSTPDLYQIITKYSSATNHLINNICLESGLDISTSKTTIINDAEGSVGSRLCPTQRYLKLHIHNFQKSLSNISLLNKDWVKYHNLYTFYTLQLQGFVTGYREVGSPYITYKDIFKINIPGGTRYLHIAAISDKDNEAHYKTRHVAVNEAVINQLEHYKQHRKLILKRFHNSNRKLFSIAKKLDFFLIDKNTPVILKPGITKKIIGKDFILPLNVNRRYLRTKLVERNVRTEITNAFMGHWKRGQEFWGTSSTLPYSHIAMETIDEITEINNALGWKAIASLEERK